MDPKRIASQLSSAGDHALHSSIRGASQDANLQIVKSTSSRIRTFLYELAEGTTNYRSIHSLTEQVEHQYHGRFIVELIQNAHDALLPPGSESDRPARIEIALKNDGKFGALYVANDGQPFSSSYRILCVRFAHLLFTVTSVTAPQWTQHSIRVGG